MIFVVSHHQKRSDCVSCATVVSPIQTETQAQVQAHADAHRVMRARAHAGSTDGHYHGRKGFANQAKGSVLRFKSGG